MAETTSSKTRLTGNQKSPNNFNNPNGVVGLQILAALNHDDDDHRQDSIFINGFSSGLVPISQKFPSNPIPILTTNKPFDKYLSMAEMEFCEEHTCLISHVGDKSIKKREYFEADLLGYNQGRERVFAVSDYSVSLRCNDGDGGGFLNTCFLCDKMLDGLDIFMYRGEKAFCSVECRHEQISIDERKEKRNSSKMRKPMDCSVSPCSRSPMQLFAGFAAA